METWNHFTSLLAALHEAAHGRGDSAEALQTVLSSFARLVEAEAGARLAGQDSTAANGSPLSDPGIRRVLAGLIDLASYRAGPGDDFRELRGLLEAFESTPADDPPAPSGPEPSPENS